GAKFDNCGEAFPNGKFLRITAETAVKHGAIHKQTDIERKQETKFLLRHRFNVSHANKPWESG
ncbi:hypothetical protein J3T48_29205, partial [Salmonella enterica]|nr:hypothetical protein [Salmonella enterica]MCU7088065.1 hypothetical protein [Salmonella enterica]